MANELSNPIVLPWERNSVGKRKTRIRVGRGQGSGLGKTSGRGTKGQQSRRGYKRKLGFEGGQMPLHRRLPKKGFHNLFGKDYEVLKIARLSAFPAGTVVTADSLKAAGLIKRIGADGVKLIGNDALGVALHVRVAKLTGSAAAAIQAAGGTIEGPVPGE